LDECGAMEGMRELVVRGIRREFKLDSPEHRIPATLDGEGRTDPNQMRDGFLIDDRGRFLEFNKEHQKAANEKYYYNRGQMDKQKLRYDNNIRILIRYVTVNISSSIKEKLKALGEIYEDMVINEDLPGILKIIKKIATERGANSIVLESQRLIRIKMSGESEDDVIKTINKFKESVDQLRYERTDKQVLEGLIDGLFVCIFAYYKPLENQIEKIYEEKEYPSYKKMAETFMNVLEQKSNHKERMIEQDREEGLISVNMATEHRRNSINKLVCFKYGGVGHVMRKCTVAAKFLICTICKKSHHVKAHDIATKMSKDKLNKAYGPVKDSDTVAFMTEEEVASANLDQLEQSMGLDELVAAQLSVTNDYEDDDIIENNHSYVYEDDEEEFGGMTTIIENNINSDVVNNNNDNVGINNNNIKNDMYLMIDNDNINLNKSNDNVKNKNNLNNINNNDNKNNDNNNDVYHKEDVMKEHIVIEIDSGQGFQDTKYEDKDIHINKVKLNNKTCIKTLDLKSSIDKNCKNLGPKDKFGKIIDKNELTGVMSNILFRLVGFLLSMISVLEGKKEIKVCRADDMRDYMEERNNVSIVEDNIIEEYFSDEE